MSSSLAPPTKFIKQALALVLLFFIRNAFRKSVLLLQKYRLLQLFLEIKISFIIFIFIELIHVLAFLKLLLFLVWILFSPKNLSQKYSRNSILDSCFLLFFLFGFAYFPIFKLVFRLLHWIQLKKIILFLFILHFLFLILILIVILNTLVQKFIILKGFIKFLVKIFILWLSLFSTELMMEDLMLTSFFLTYFLLDLTYSSFLLTNLFIFLPIKLLFLPKFHYLFLILPLVI